LEKARSDRLVPNDEPGTQEVYWSNRGEPEYASQYDGPAPDVPIRAELAVTKYAIAIAKNAGDTLRVANNLAEVAGKVQLYEATLKTESLTGSGLHASGELDPALPPNLAVARASCNGVSLS